MRYLFLFFFGYLVYQYLLKPLFAGAKEQPRYRNPQEDMAEMLRRMQAQQQGHPYEPQQKPQKAQNKKSEGEYIDYEEVE